MGQEVEEDQEDIQMGMFTTLQPEDYLSFLRFVRRNRCKSENVKMETLADIRIFKRQQRLLERRL